MATLSEAILRRAGGLARPGGRVVFAVCSVLTAECEAVIERVSDVLVPAPFDAPEVLPLLEAPRGSASGGGGAKEGTLRLSPRRHETDGFFIASLVRRE
jgi:16S rRNA (cytosine967-C5)-methyltransferase